MYLSNTLYKCIKISTDSHVISINPIFIKVVMTSSVVAILAQIICNSTVE